MITVYDVVIFNGVTNSVITTLSTYDDAYTYCEHTNLLAYTSIIEREVPVVQGLGRDPDLD